MSSLGFEIGFDHFRLGLPLDIGRFNDHHKTDIRQGFEAARIQGVSRHKADVYEKKLLSLRDRALIKGLAITLTCEQLKQKLDEAGDCCPITYQAFTYAEHNDTDWSVDRIDNTQGYHADNIVIVSRIANTAKSDLDLIGIVKKSIAKNHDNRLLSDAEWIRMARFYYHKTRIERPLCFCRLLDDTGTLYDQILYLQLLKHNDRCARRFLKQLEKYISREAIQKARKLSEKRAYQKASIDVEVLSGSPKLSRWLDGFKQAIRAHTGEFDGLLMDCMYA
jgi:hypothetical protein